jgi:hypothetical protein
MSDIATIQGACRCGQVTFALSARPVVTMACHCVGCQKMSASAFSLSALFPVESFKLTSGEPVIGGLHGEARHYFCPHCMSRLFTRPAGVDAFINVRSTLLDHPEQYAPLMETWTAEKLPWVTTGATRSFPGLPDPQDYPGLMEEYARRSA